jgi:hypothetical protein
MFRCSSRQPYPPWRRQLTIAAALVAVVALLVGAPAAPAVAQDLPTKGVLTLYANPDFSGQAHVISYLTCRGNITGPVQVGSYDNRPPEGCTVGLVNRQGQTHVLCVGRAVVPPEFTRITRIVLTPGTSLPCQLGPPRR